MIPELGPIRILAWKPEARGTMLGFFDLAWGEVILRRCTLHADESGCYSVGLPTRKDSPEGDWVHVFDFTSRLAREEFRHLALQSLLAFFEKQQARCAVLEKNPHAGFRKRTEEYYATVE